jgi:hypothetical protein
MELEEFEVQLRAIRAARAGREYPPGFQLFDSLLASDEDLAIVETALRTRLPQKYKEFMRRFGGGAFLFLELLPARSEDGRLDDLLARNKGDFAVPNFVAVAPVGTGDWWGFVTSDGVCEEQVYFWDHEDGHVEPDCPDFLDFAARHGFHPA